LARGFQSVILGFNNSAFTLRDEQIDRSFLAEVQNTVGSFFR
jgi:hypothetical protein